MNDFNVYARRGRLFTLLGSSLIFVAIGIYIFWDVSSATARASLAGVIGMVTIGFFGLCFLFYLFKIFSRRPLVVVSTEGILDNSSFLAAGTIQWAEMRDIRFVKSYGQVFLGIYTHDSELVIRRTKGIRRLLNRWNQKLIDTPINIPVRLLSCSMEELANEISRRRGGFFSAIG